MSQKAKSITKRNRMSTNNQMTEEVELQEVEVQYWVDQAEALTRLENGTPRPDDFKKVILEGYFKDRALDGVSMLGTDYVKQSGKRPEVMEILVAISTLQDHFHTIKNLGSIAEDDRQELEGPEVE